MSKEKNEVVVKETAELVEVKKFELDMRGYEDMDMGDLTLPTVKLMQPTSPELTDEDFDLKMGQIVNSLSKETMEVFVPLKLYKDRIMFVPKNDSDKKYMTERVKQTSGYVVTTDDMDSLFMCRSEDNKTGDKFGNCAICPFAKFDGNKKPLCNQNINALGLFEDDGVLDMLPTVIRFSSTSKKHGDNFYKLTLVLGKGAPLFSRKYKLASLKKQQDGNTWYELTVKPAGKLEAADYEQAEAMYEMFRTQKFEADDTMPNAVEEDLPFTDEAVATEKKADATKEKELEF